jgi:hypothetical protein
MSRLTRFLFGGSHGKTPYAEYMSIQQVEPQDVFIAGFPKSGNTWVQLLVAAMLFDFKPETMPDTLVQELVPDVHFKKYYKRFLSTMAFKTHDLPKQHHRRVLNIVRDGRDAICSYKHYNDALGTSYSLDQMIETGAGMFPCPWHQHVQAWEQNPFDAERLVVRYEDLKQRCAVELRRIADFLALDISQERLRELALGTGVNKMQQREVVLGWNHPAWPRDKKFIRKGVTGSFRSELSPDQVAKFEAHAGDVLARLGYKLDYARCA